MKTLIIVLVILFIAYEFIEHVAFPLVWSLVRRKKKPTSGPERILGEVGEVKKWNGKEGYLFVGGELWKANSQFPLEAGDKVVIKKIEGLTLKVDLWIPNEGR